MRARSRRKANAGREKEFVARRDQQAALLAQAQKERDAAAARSQALSAQFDANEVKLTELGELRNSRLGSLGELFGVVRQASADASSVVYDSMISAQYPGPRRVLRLALEDDRRCPIITELEQLWFEMQREMTETGRVARFQTNIVTEDGSLEGSLGGAHRRLHRDHRRRPLPHLSPGRANPLGALAAAGLRSCGSWPGESKRPRAGTSRLRSIPRAASCSRSSCRGRTSGSGSSTAKPSAT